MLTGNTLKGEFQRTRFHSWIIS